MRNRTVAVDIRIIPWYLEQPHQQLVKGSRQQIQLDRISLSSADCHSTPCTRFSGHHRCYMGRVRVYQGQFHHLSIWQQWDYLLSQGGVKILKICSWCRFRCGWHSKKTGTLQNSSWKCYSLSLRCELLVSPCNQSRVRVVNSGEGTAVSGASRFLSVATFSRCSEWPPGPLDRWPYRGVSIDGVSRRSRRWYVHNFPSNSAAYWIVGVFLGTFIGNCTFPSKHEVFTGVLSESAWFV